MSNHDFNLVNYDTDSIMVCKPDGSAFDSEEQSQLLIELNSLFPKRIKWEPDGYFHTVAIIKAKNYILYDGKKLKIKGAALKATTKEPALQEYIKEVIDCIIEGRYNHKEVYDKYAKEIMSLTDIKRWATRKTLTNTVFAGEQTTAKKVLDAIDGTEYTEGDRAYFFFKPDESLELVENFTGEYHVDKLLEKLFKTSSIFHTVIPKDTFPNYKLKRNKILLSSL